METNVDARRLCPICDHRENHVVFRQQFTEISMGSLLSGYDVVVCHGCGFAYADHIPDQAAFDAYYRDMSKYEFQGPGGKEEFDVPRFRAITEILGSIAPRDASILEIGCATGGQLGALKESGYEKLVGLDPSPLCVETTKRLYGVDAVCGSLAELVGSQRRFDVILMSNVLEHIPDVRPALAGLRQLLRDDGILFVEVPNVIEFSRWDDAPFQQFSTEHINFFSPRTLANLLQTAGFMLVRCEQNSYAVAPGQTWPAIDAVFRRSTLELPQTHVEKDSFTEAALAEYVAKSRRVEARILGTIDELVASGRPIVVWGVGTHTQRLLSTSRLGEAVIAAFVDANPHYQGKQLHGVPIIPSEALAGRTEPILISSRVFQGEIAKQIRETLRLDNALYTLYEL